MEVLTTENSVPDAEEFYVLSITYSGDFNEAEPFKVLINSAKVGATVTFVDAKGNEKILNKGHSDFIEETIDSLKTNMFKIQIAFDRDFSEKDFENFNILSFKKNGSVATLILKGDREKYETFLSDMNPVILDFLPLTLEEIFIYEMEVLGYEFNKII